MGENMKPAGGLERGKGKGEEFYKEMKRCDEEVEEFERELKNEGREKGEDCWREMTRMKVNGRSLKGGEKKGAKG